MKSKESNRKSPDKAQEGIFDARTLGTPRMLVLGIQHMFAMFGATVLVPALTGLSVSSTLFFAGVGTLLFHLISKGIVPAFLGSSFAFLAGYWAIAPEGEADLLPYACFGVACAGVLYLILSGLFRAFGVGRVMRFFPPVVTGPIIIAIGLNLSKSAVDNCASNWWIALTAILVVVVANIWGKGMIRIIPIILGVVVSYAVAAVTGNVDFTPVSEAAWIGFPVSWDSTVFSILPNADVSLLITAAVTIIPIALATMIEHIGDMSADLFHSWKEIISRIRDFTGHSWGTEWPLFWLRFSALRPIRLTVKIRVFSLLRRYMIRESFVWRRSSLYFCLFHRKWLLSLP